MTGFALKSVLAATAAAVLLSGAASAADWSGKYKELRIGVTTAENEKDQLARWAPFTDYLEKKLGTKVRLYRGSDYAAVIEALKAGHVEFGRMGAAAYAKAYKVMGDKIRPVANEVDSYGSSGYYSVVVVRTDSPFKSLDDLKGKTLAFADPNSTSGFAVPTYFLSKQGKDPRSYFSRTGFAGNHEQGVIAVIQGTYDAAATWWRNDGSSNVQRMVDKKMIEGGKVREIWKSPVIPNGPFVARADLPPQLIKDYTDALIAVATDAPDVWKTLRPKKMKGIAPVAHQDFVDIINIREENAKRRRQRSGS